MRDPAHLPERRERHPGATRQRVAVAADDPGPIVDQRVEDRPVQTVREGLGRDREIDPLALEHRCELPDQPDPELHRHTVAGPQEARHDAAQELPGDDRRRAEPEHPGGGARGGLGVARRALLGGRRVWRPMAGGYDAGSIELVVMDHLRHAMDCVDRTVVVAMHEERELGLRRAARGAVV